MSKQSYLEALELLRQRVDAAATEEELNELQADFRISNIGELVDDRIDDYIESKIENEAEVGPGEALDAISEEILSLALAVLSMVVRLKRDREEIKQKIVEALPDEREIAERRRFFAAESAEAPPAGEERPDAPDNMWDVSGRLDDDRDDWDRDDDDDPDYDDVYGDDDEEYGE